jgi:O-antigen ligase
MTARDFPNARRSTVWTPNRGFAAGAWRLVTSPAAAFVLLFPTLGYYTLATYVNVIDPASSLGSIVIRAGSLLVLFVAFASLARHQKRSLGYLLLPASLFLVFYSYRVMENVLYRDMIIPPGNLVVVLTFLMSCIVPAYMLAWSERGIRDDDMRAAASLLAILFVVGMALNWEALVASSERRLALEKVNPISLAYVASSLMLFYLLAFSGSKRAKIEAIVIVPIMLLIVSLARSRGMILSTGLTLVVYVLALHGKRRIKALLLFVSVGLAIGLCADPRYLENVMQALSLIDMDADISTASRAVSFQGAWLQFLDHPLFGRYAVELQLNYYPHNIYLESLMSVGLIGTVPFAIHLTMALRAAWGLLRERERSLSRAFVALLFIREAIGAAASGAIWSVAGFWITSFLVIAMWYPHQRERHLPGMRGRVTGARPPADRVSIPA